MKLRNKTSENKWVNLTKKIINFWVYEAVASERIGICSPKFFFGIERLLLTENENFICWCLCKFDLKWKE